MLFIVVCLQAEPAWAVWCDGCLLGVIPGITETRIFFGVSERYLSYIIWGYQSHLHDVGIILCFGPKMGQLCSEIVVVKFGFRCQNSIDWHFGIWIMCHLDVMSDVRVKCHDCSKAKYDLPSCDSHSWCPAMHPSTRGNSRWVEGNLSVAALFQ